MHWTDPYIGRPYALGVMDCARLAVEVSRDVFHRPPPAEAEVTRAASRGTRDTQIRAGVEAVARLTMVAEEGDIVLMMCRGRASHVGVYCLVDGEPSVLHAMENAGSVVRHRLRDLVRVQLTVEGFYQWK